ncbi:MAG: PepSY-associated TM helix domain-containing protein [Desulfotalea sp.]
MKWRKFNNALHRDLGYLCFGLTLLYAISGVAVNHIGDWNPTYRIERISTSVEAEGLLGLPDAQIIEVVTRELGERAKLKNSYRVDDQNIKIFLENNNISVNLATGQVHMEKHVKRPFLYQANFLHLNHAKKLWTWVADIFGVALVLLAITGLFVLRGKKGIKGRGAVLTVLGMAIPLLFLVLYA